MNIVKAKSVLLGFLIGGVAASISTLLTTPVSGKDSRQYIRKNTECFKKQLIELKSQLIDLKNSLIHASKEGKESISAFSSELKASINNWMEEITPNQQNIQKELQAIEIAIQELEENLNKENEIK